MSQSNSIIISGDSKLQQALREAMPDDWGILLSAFASSYGIGLLVLLALPFMIGVSVDELGLTESQAGLVGSLEFAAIMSASLIVAPFINRLPRRHLAMFGTVLALTGNLLCVFQAQPLYADLILYRLIAGAGCGLTLAVGNGTISSSANPEKMAGQMSTLFVALMAVTMIVFAWAAETWGYQGLYVSLVVSILAVSPLLLKLPQRAIEQPATNEHPHAHKQLISVTSIVMLLAMFMFALRDMSAWAFVERVGIEAGYSAGQVGMLLSAQALVGISGPLIATVVGARFGIKIPLVVGIVSSGLVYFVMLRFPTSELVYAGSAMFIGCTYFFTLAYLTAFAAELDTQGRIVAASGGFLSGGIALGPTVGGYLIEEFGYGPTSWAVLAMAALTLVFAYCALLSMRSTP